MPPLLTVSVPLNSVVLLRSTALLLSKPLALLWTIPVLSEPRVTLPVPTVSVLVPVTLVGPLRLTAPVPVLKLPVPV